MERKYGLNMNLPDGKIPGYYAQIVKGIAERATLFDRHKELLIFDSAGSFPPVLELLNHYKVEAEPCELMLLPAEGFSPGTLFDDYGISTRSDNHFIDLALTAVFAIKKAKPDAETAPALLQLEEHIIGESKNDDGTMLYLLDRQLTELAERIAKAYGCEVVWVA